MKYLSSELEIAITASKTGAKNALKYFNHPVRTEIKEDGTVVSHADKETEEVIKFYISSKLPDAKFLGEESGGNVNEKEFWVIDPIDGSRSFLRGIETWCVIVSLCRNNDVYLSVIYYPHENKTYYAQRGKGAFENNKRLHVSDVKKLKDAYLGFGSPRHFKNKQVVMDLIEKSASSRSWEATYSACLVVAGKMDVHVDAFGKIWDLAPFKVMIEEAGGKITRLDGLPWALEGYGGIMSNELLHDEVLKIVNKKQ